MTPVSASLRCAVFCAALALSGCQTTGTNKWIPANPNADDTVAASGDSDVPVAGAQETAFELGSKDPYAYKDIPPGVRPALDTREAGLWLMVDKIEEKGKTAGNRLTDARMNAYLEEIVCNMSGPYCRDVRVYIQRVPLFNASMAPNGMMTVFSGFLLRVQNEAQLAAVIGHEIGHYIRRHSVQRLEDAIAKHDFAMVFGMFAAGIGVPVAGDVVQLALLGSQYSFSRDNEREADLIGINLMHMRGYDAREAGKIWELLLRERDPETDPEGDQAGRDRAAPAEAQRRAHDLRQELTTIMGLAEILARDEAGAEDRRRTREYAQAILASGARVLDMVSDQRLPWFDDVK